MAAYLNLGFLFVLLFVSPLAHARTLEVTGEADQTASDLQVVKPTYFNRVKYNEELCEACQLVSEHLSSLLSDSNTTQLIIAALKSSFCGKFTGALKKQCDILVEEYIPEIISSLETSLETGDFCVNQQICDAESPKPKGIRKHDSKCDLCEIAAAQFKDYIQKNETQAKIVSVLYSVCSKIKGGTVTEACHNVVDAYYPDFVDIVSSLSTKEFCTYIGYCSLSKAFPYLRVFIPSATAKQNAFSQPGDCFACKMMVAYFRNKLKDAGNQEKFKNTLLSSCDKVPNYVEECRSAVVEYLPVFYSNLDSIFNSTLICEKVEACTPHFDRVIRLPSFHL